MVVLHKMQIMLPLRWILKILLQIIILIKYLPVSYTHLTTSGGATVSITGSKVTLTSISQKQASIDLNVTLEDGVSIVKTWYVNKVANGENGFNGEDAAYVYMSGEQFFHYKTGKTVPENTTITLTADSRCV